jgi:signal transduction histidine kinase
MAAPSSSQSRLSRLVLISAAGLLILGLVTLGMALRNTEAFAREEARSRSADTVGALHANLARPAILHLLPPDSRFAIEEGTLVVAVDVAALDGQRNSAETELREQTLRNRIDRVEREQGLAAALEDLDEDLGSAEAKGVTPLLLLIETAWRAQKGIESEAPGMTDLERRRSAALQSYETTRKETRDTEEATPIPLSMDRSAFLLRARAGMAAPAWSSELLGKLAPGQREALVARAADLSSEEFARSHFVDALAAAERTWARKSLLEQVRGHAGSLLGHQESWSSIVGENILLWFPSENPMPAGKEAGQGALVDQNSLIGHLRRATGEPQQAAKAGLVSMTWSGTLERQPEAPDLGLSIWPGLWLIPASPTVAGFGGQPWFLGLLFILVFVLLIVGLWQILDSMKRERASIALRSEFLTSVTHELKTPLSSIRLFTEMLAEDRVPSETKRKEYHRLLAGEAGRLSALVENVLDLGRMERGERSYDQRDEDLVALVEEAVDLFRPIAEAEGMEIQFENASGEAVQVSVDRTALMQSLLNLFENARKYASQGGQLELHLEERDGEARLRIQDLGPGIPAAERESVFERFRRGESQRSGSVPGVGLGLYLARRILRTHGGELEAVDPPQGFPGACFLLRLPLASNH